MDAVATNLHFHGLSVPPVCHQDDVLHTLIGPGDPPFEYRFQIPPDEPPGLYWYHPHVHGFSNAQVLGGASGALIVEGIERENRQLAGLPERVLIIRDQELLNPDAEPSQSGGRAPTLLRETSRGDILNTGMDGGKPAKDVSVNFVPVAYPDFPPAVLAMKPSERQLWRVLNASAITYLDLDVLLGGMAQLVGVVSLGAVRRSMRAAGPRIASIGEITSPCRRVAGPNSSCRVRRKERGRFFARAWWIPAPRVKTTRRGRWRRS